MDTDRALLASKLGSCLSLLPFQGHWSDTYQVQARGSSNSHIGHASHRTAGFLTKQVCTNIS